MELFWEILDNLQGYLKLASITDIIDILIVAFLIYKVLTLVRQTNAIQIIKAILILLVLLWVSQLLSLHVLNFLLMNTMQIGFLALIIVFQPELRRLLEQVGRSRFPSLLGRSQAYPTEMDQAIIQTVEACASLSWSRTGALIVFERNVPLTDVIKTGTVMDAQVNSMVLKNIFFPKAPLHDGAVIISGARISGAGCMLPMSANTSLSRDLGMRHRAGVGVSENSDAVSVIVSEETGSISVATGGMLKRHLASETLEILLRNELLPQKNEENKGQIKNFLGFMKGKKHGKDTKK